MLKRTVGLALVLVLLSGGLLRSQAQEKKKPNPKDAELEDMYQQALQKNADIRVAEARVREAEAELDRIRQQVLHKILKFHHDVDAAKALAEEYRARYERELELFKKGASSLGEVGAAKATWEKGKADLKVLEAQLPYLLGKQATEKAPVFKESVNEGTREPSEVLLKPYAKAAKISEKLAEKLRKALDTPIKGIFKDRAVPQVFEFLKEHAAKEINIHFNLPDRALNETAVNLDVSAPVPLGAVFQWFEDRFEWRFVVREYGIVVVERDNVPPGALLVHDFWKAAPPKEEKEGA